MQRVEALADGLLLDGRHDDRAFLAGVLGDLADRCLQRATQDVDADRLVAFELELVERRDGLQERGAAAGDDALLDRRAGGRKRVLDAVLLLLELDLGRGADLDDGNATGQLGEALLELLAVVVGGGLLDLRLDLGHARP